VIFVDASALVAIIASEPDGMRLAEIVKDEIRIACSAVSIWETMSALSHSYKFLVPTARATVDNYVRGLRFEYVPIGEREAEIAAEAYATYGKGRHPAALNMGDCFAYACARANNAKLLFKGDDFAKTDIAAALSISRSSHPKIL